MTSSKLYSISEAEALRANKANTKRVLSSFSPVAEDGGKFNDEITQIAKSCASRLKHRMTAQEFEPALDNGLENKNAVQAAQNILQKITSESFENQNGFRINFSIRF